MRKFSKAEIEVFGERLEAMREESLAKVGEKDARYIRSLIGFQRLLDIGSRLVMACAFLFLSGAAMWTIALLATIGLAVSKILNNMEIGHNVMHGQYDWMNDPNINSVKFDWDIASDSDSWRRYHNYEHHTFTNVLGKDRDFGYGLLRLSGDYKWKPKNRFQIFTYLVLSFFFEWGVAYHELAAERVFMGKKKRDSELPISRKELRNAFFKKAGKQVFKDYIFFPLLFLPVALPVLICNFFANMLRNLWTSTIIFCGHFTEGAHVFYENDIQNETRGEWYYRQILGSSNIEGSKTFHIMTGHLSCQIEHHLFPDLPSHYYRKLSPKVKELCAEYGIPYNTGRFSKQYAEVVRRIWTYSFPTKEERISASS